MRGDDEIKKGRRSLIIIIIRIRKLVKEKVTNVKRNIGKCRVQSCD